MIRISLKISTYFEMTKSAASLSVILLLCSNLNSFTTNSDYNEYATIIIMITILLIYKFK